MNNFYYTELANDCKSQSVQLTENEKKAIEKIENAQSQDEIINVISDELTRSLISQINL